MARCGTKSALRNSRGAWDDSAVAALKIGGSVSRPSVFRYNLWSFLPNKSAPLAQLDRASGYEPEGREFESLRAHHSKIRSVLGFTPLASRQSAHRFVAQHSPTQIPSLRGGRTVKCCAWTTIEENQGNRCV